MNKSNLIIFYAYMHDGKLLQKKEAARSDLRLVRCDNPAVSARFLPTRVYTAVHTRVLIQLLYSSTRDYAICIPGMQEPQSDVAHPNSICRHMY
jgi:hypothetical protein